MRKVDPMVVAALKAAAKEAGQSGEVVRMVVAWLDASATGSVSLGDADESFRRITDLLGAVKPPKAPASDPAEQGT